MNDNNDNEFNYYSFLEFTIEALLLLYDALRYLNGKKVLNILGTDLLQQWLPYRTGNLPIIGTNPAEQ